VTTIAGDGKQGNDLVGGKSGKEQPLSTPWDVAVSPDGEKKPTRPPNDHLIVSLSLAPHIWITGIRGEALCGHGWHAPNLGGFSQLKRGKQLLW